MTLFSERFVRLIGKRIVGRSPERHSLWLLGFLVFGALFGESVVGLSETTAAEQEKETDFVSLYDGQSLAGWDGDPKHWSVEEGVIVGRTSDENPIKANTFLIWNGEVEDFVLRLRFRVEDFGRGNSGIQYRSRRIPKRGKWAVGGYQADIDRTNQYMGILYDERGRGILAERGERVVIQPRSSKNGGKNKLVRKVEKLGDSDELLEGIKPGEWVDYEVSAIGPRLVHKLNGREVANITDLDEGHNPKRGILALQLHTGPAMEIRFKDIRLKNLSKKKANPNDSEEESNEQPSAFQTNDEGVTTLVGFQAEKIYEVPKDKQGSWVSMTVDDRGRLITSDQYGKLYRVTVLDASGKPTEPSIEEIPIEMGMAQGLCFVDGRLYVMVNRSTKEINAKSGLYLVTDSNDDDMFDKVELLREIKGQGEHGPHAIVLSPDRKSLTICGGNHTDLPKLDSSRVPRNWKEDLLLPRMWDARGHAQGKLAPGGWIAKVGFDGKNLELISSGFRNEYDIAYNVDGELFTYDADMEWDIGAPWYRPTRINHVTSGSEFGWRSGTGKWPSYYPDSLPEVVNIGPGSPTGVLFGTGARFPAKYQRAMYACDWSYGVIYAIHMTPDGASYTGTIERFVSAAPLPATDLVVNPVDGAMYFTVGGRKAQSALYRVTYSGNESTQNVFSASSGEALADEMMLRYKLESLHQPAADVEGAKEIVDEAWPLLGHSDRHIRFAARIALEHQPVAVWQDRALSEKDATRSIHAILALARCGDKSKLPQMLDRLSQIDWSSLDETGRIDLLRAYQVSMARMGRPSSEIANRVIAQLNPNYPSNSMRVNRELSQVLIYLEAPDVVARTLELLNNSLTKQEQIHYALSLRSLPSGWTPESRQAYLDWFHQAAAHRGGMSFSGFINNIRKEFIAGMSKEEQNALAQEIANVPAPGGMAVEETPREMVKKWTVEDLALLASKSKSGRNFERGRKMFAVAQCFKCHRVRGEGETIGPDLTGSGKRFSARDLLESIVEPSKEISDQYRQTMFVVNGKGVIGRVVNVRAESFDVSSNMLDPSKLVHVKVDEIDEQAPSKVSVMPESLLDTLTKEEILDLLAYLRSGGDPDDRLFQKE